MEGTLGMVESPFSIFDAGISLIALILFSSFLPLVMCSDNFEHMLFVIEVKIEFLYSHLALV